MEAKLDVLIFEIQKLKSKVNTLTKIVNCQNNHTWKEYEINWTKTRQCSICNLKEVSTNIGGRRSDWTEWEVLYDSDNDF